MTLKGTEIPDKRYFKIGEVSAITGLDSYVLRYWETEFPLLKPSRSRSGQRLKRDNLAGRDYDCLTCLRIPPLSWLSFTD